LEIIEKPEQLKDIIGADRFFALTSDNQKVLLSFNLHAFDLEQFGKHFLWKEDGFSWKHFLEK
jgi:hypothetical protein